MSYISAPCNEYLKNLSASAFNSPCCFIQFTSLGFNNFEVPPCFLASTSDPNFLRSFIYSITGAGLSLNISAYLKTLSLSLSGKVPM
jgi:hypothetical protein